MRRLLATSIAALVGLGASGNLTAAGLLSSTGPVIAILAGDLYHGEAVGHLDGSGTVRIQSLATPALACYGNFTSSKELGGAGSLECTDGLIVTFKFKRLTITRGHGTGTSSRGPLSFTYGLSPAEAEPYLKIAGLNSR
jgi:hypothetical protein